ncbi:N-acetylmuramoyl-L-alanine amidase [Elusimicrobium minutum Pei191]|uniref:N-acetylmuramoyl-L-alanine amidase n=1 Tax=Elusimicrobium minutum (strain Pei191) TaxID=445932 RepID=B2KB35_ELUMP|nr:N-acetylmuramoyl-L-alanine amidase [Elusimicrobium minutum]ACC97794.1 N-acetylmuramoyl-L-alanine amidase [Elusimicrobium minutum Pei191]
MKRNYFFAFLLLISAALSYAQDVPVAANLPLREKNPETVYPISVEYPHENMYIPMGTKATFIFGNISNPKAALTINNVPVPVYKTGGFLAFLPIEEGKFTFNIETDDGVVKHQATRTVNVDGVKIKEFKEASFEIKTIKPQTDIWAVPGDKIELSAFGMPGSSVTAAISGLKEAKNIELKEVESGFYQAFYIITDKDQAKAAKITYRIFHEPTGTKNRAVAPGRLKILEPKDFVTAEIKAPGSRIRNQAVKKGSLYPFYNMYGNIVIDGLYEGMYRVRLGEKHSGWIEESKVRPVRKTPSLNKIETVTTEDLTTKTRITFYGKNIVPVLTESGPTSFNMTFFYTDYNIPVIEDPISTLVNNIVFEIIDDTTIKFNLNYAEGQILWGYDYAYDEKGNLVLELMHKPFLNPQPGKPLAGAKIMLDPGHSPRRKPDYDGAIGPTGLLEYEVNMQTAKELASLLAKTGAEVIMSKNETEQTSLQQRAAAALKSGAHIFVSIHHNALPVGANPLSKERGFTVYYFHEHSKKLAEDITKGFVKNVKLPNMGTWPGDFYVVRTPQLPAVLTENAFLMYPNQEEMVRNDKTRQAFVKAIYEGILNFYNVKIDEPATAATKPKVYRHKKKITKNTQVKKPIMAKSAAQAK